MKTKLLILGALLAAAQGALALFNAPAWARLVVLVVIAGVAVAQAVDGLRTQNREHSAAELASRQTQIEAKDARDRAVSRALRVWPAPMVSEADPFEFGVKRSALADRFRAPSQRAAPYVSRDVDPAADSRLRASGSVLLIGVPGAGVTRTAFEIARRTAPSARLVAPRPQGLQAALDNGMLASLPPRCQVVLWLDGIDSISADNTTAAALRELRRQSSGLRVIATVPSGDRYQRWIADDPELAAEFGEPVVVRRLPVSDSESQRAAELYQGVDFTYGIAAAFTATAALLKRLAGGYTTCGNPQCDGDCAIARTMIDVAVHWASTGTPRPLPIDVLKRLTRQAITVPKGIDKEHFLHALDWATSPVEGSASLLRIDVRGDGREVVTAHDAVVQSGLDGSLVTSNKIWSAALDDAADDANALGQIGFRAHLRGRAEITERVWAGISDRSDPAARWLWMAAEVSLHRHDGATVRQIAESRILELIKRMRGSDSAEAALAYCRLGTAYMDADQQKKALAEFAHAKRVIDAYTGTDQALVSNVLGNLGNAWVVLGERQQAIAAFEKALAVRTRLFGDESAEAAQILVGLGNAWSNTDPLRAKDFHEQALRIHERLHGKASLQVAEDLTNLGNAVLALDQDEDALRLYERALPILRREFGPDHPQICVLLNNMANAHMQRGNTQSAQKLYERVFTIRRREFGDGSASTAVSMVNLALTDVELGNPQAGLTLLDRALPILQRELGADHPFVADAMERKGTAWSKLGNRAESRKWQLRSMQLREKLYGPAHLSIAVNLYALAGDAIDEGDPSTARDLLVKALSILRANHPRGKNKITLVAERLRIAAPELVVLDDARIVAPNEGD